MTTNSASGVKGLTEMTTNSARGVKGLTEMTTNSAKPNRVAIP